MSCAFYRLWRQLVRLLVVAPVADIADPLGGEEIGGVWRFLEIRPGPTDRAFAGRPFDRLDRCANVMPLLIFGHADVDDLAARQTVRNELGVTLLALLA